MALDARLNTSLLMNPYWTHLDPRSVAAYVNLLMFSVANMTDGYVDTKFITGRYPIAHVTTEALAELAEAGLLEVLPGEHLQLDWTFQTPADRIRTKRENDRERQARYRKRQKQESRKSDHSESNADVTRDVTRDARVSRLRVGQDRHRTGSGQAQDTEKARHREEEAAVLGESNQSQPEAGYDAWANTPIAKPGSGINY